MDSVSELVLLGAAVESPPLPKNRWMLTQDAFELLLAQLDGDRQEAGTKYEILRHKLVKFFQWRGCIFAEDLADDTINRVARNLTAGEKIGSLPAYCAGVARRVFLEWLRSNQQEETALRDMSHSSATPKDKSDQREDCLERCLQELSPPDYQLIVQYYQHADRARIEVRRDLAEQLSIPLNALRIRAHRIRVRLQKCVEDCVKRAQES